MQKIYKASFVFLSVAIFCLAFGTTVSAQFVPQVQTSAATNIQSNSANLNADITYLGSNGSVNVYFQWGTTPAYGYQTPIMTQNYIGYSSQTISGLFPNTTYHFRAVAQNNSGTVYGQDMAFVAGQSNNNILTANAGSDLYLTSGQTAIMQGSGYDPNGYVLNYYWTCSGGTLSNYNVAQPVYTAPYNGQTTYTCTLTVTNTLGNSNTDSMIVYVNYNNNGSTYVQTTYATYISSSQVNLNGSLSNTGLTTNSVYFQWGTTTNYGNQTPQQYIDYAGSFIQDIANLNSGTTYHFRAVAQGNYGTVYGQDMTFTTSGSGYGYYGNGSLSVTKQAIDLSSGNLNWSSSVSANPSDIISFAVTLQSNGQDIHNVVVRDILPANLIYKGNLTVNTNSNYGGDIFSGINIGTVYAGQTVVVSYQAQVAAAGNLSFGATTLTNDVTVTSNEAGTQTSSATVIVNKAVVYGASTISTGLTNNFLADSFFLPLLLILAGLWFYFSGRAYRFADWLKATK
jgi:hypothetical protein